MKRDIFIFMGPPGAGKGSLSTLCTQELGYTQISTGNLCRKHILEQTNIGLEIDFAIKSGKLIPDSLIVEMVKDWLVEQAEQKNPIILDGFPRTVAQAQALEDLLKNFSHLKLCIVRFMLTDETIVSRLESRYVCKNKDCQIVYSMAAGSSLAPIKYMICDVCQAELMRRHDDHPETVRERLAIYRKYENDLIEYYQQIGYKIHEFDVDRLLASVFEDFKKLFGLKKQ